MRRAGRASEGDGMSAWQFIGALVIIAVIIGAWFSTYEEG